MSETWALDIGSTSIKLGSLASDGTLRLRGRTDSPPLSARHGRLYADPLAYLNAIDTLFDQVAPPATARLGLCCQRSSFLLWQRTDGAPVTPLYSWQDTHARHWCQSRTQADHQWIWQRTGLPLSPHYAGPKLAQLLAEDRLLAQRAERGELVFGTLDTFLIWRWSGGRVHRTDPSMAARTLLLDPEHGEWGADLLAFFGIPASLLPTVSPAANQVPLGRHGILHAQLADQAASAIPVFLEPNHRICANAGTGTFVLAPAAGPAPSGYLNALLDTTLPHLALLWEGALNAGAQLFDHIATPIDSLFPHDDPAPTAFCDTEPNGLGAPYWCPTPREASSLESIAAEDRLRLRVEGYFFRLRQIIDDLCPDDRASLLFSGGLSRREGLLELLSAFLERPILRLEMPEMGLWGAAWLASAHKPIPPPTPKPVLGVHHASYLPQKYRAWRQWMAARLPG